MTSHLHKQTRGWLLPYLLALDTLECHEKDFTGHGRWSYWLDACFRGVVPEGPIPQIVFRSTPDTRADHHLRDVLRYYVERSSEWYDTAFLDLTAWLLHGFGKREMETEVDRIPGQVRDYWYTTFNLAELLRCPIDWPAYVLEGQLSGMKAGRSRWADGSGFFSTPMNVTKLMTEMTFMGGDPETMKLQTVCDPCVGTGKMLLPASNYSLRLYGQDIVPDLVMCCELNGWLWAPWLAWMPAWMDDVFERASGERPATEHLRLEQDPKRVEATEAYRAGEITQLDFFETVGVQQGA